MAPKKLQEAKLIRWETPLSSCKFIEICKVKTWPQISIEVRSLTAEGTGESYIIQAPSSPFVLMWDENYQDLWYKDYGYLSPFSAPIIQEGASLEVKNSPWIHKLGNQAYFEVLTPDAKHLCIASPHLIIEWIASDYAQITLKRSH